VPNWALSAANLSANLCDVSCQTACRNVCGWLPAVQASGLEEAEALLKEIFSQNWRVELDAGLGVDLNPREHILIACTR